MKKVLVLSALLALAGVVNANLLVNGDFETPGDVPHDALGWSEYHSVWSYDTNAWANREDPQVPGDFHMAVGYYGGYGAFVWQDVSVVDDGALYKLSADISLDIWWMNSLYIKLEFWDAGAANMVGFVESDHYSQPAYDTGLPWTNYSITGIAPAGTEIVRVMLGTYGEGGTARFDNAVLEVVPEPATLMLLGLGVAVARLYRRR